MTSVLQNVAWIVAILAWFIALFTGRTSQGMRDLQAYCLRYQAQTYGYLLLLTQRYPSFSDGDPLRVETVDYHTGGEPFRIVTGGAPPLEGATILERRRFAREHLDHVRRLLVFEPRGHADMYGCHVVPPNDDGADLGVVFFHNAGYSTACGHGTIALVTWALDEGVVERREGENRVVVDVPSGRLETCATVEAGRVRSVRFRNVPSFVWADGLDAAGRRSTSPSAARSTRSLEERVAPARAAPADRARARDQGRDSRPPTTSSTRSSPSSATSTA